MKRPYLLSGPIQMVPGETLYSALKRELDAWDRVVREVPKGLPRKVPQR